ncbi:MAG: hypothetical protein GX657_11665 [Chloroflexi bacterium]|nr:hypothetical protein [Chloroflexota bacterium]
MTRRFMTGFEAGSLEVFDQVDYPGAWDVSALIARNGNYSAGIPSSVAAPHLWWYPQPPYVDEYYIRLGVYAVGGRVDRVFFSVYDGKSPQLTFWTPAGALGPIRVSRGGEGGTLLGEGGNLIGATWVCLEIHVLIHDANGVVEVKVDGTEVISFTGNTRNTATSQITALVIGANSTGGEMLFAYFDDFVVNDTSGTVNNSWPGRGGIYPAVPVGLGAYAEFTPLAGANWENVAEIPPDDDTSYVESNVYEHQDLYVTGGIAPPDGTITAVQLCHRAKLADVGIGNLRPLVRHGGVDYVGPDKAVDASYRGIRHIMERAPDDSAWSVAKVNGLQIGQQVG